MSHAIKKPAIIISTIVFLIGTIIYCTSNHQALKKWLVYNFTGEVRQTHVAKTTLPENETTAAVTTLEDSIKIPKINVDAPVFYNSGITEDEIVGNLNTGVVFYNNSSLPSEEGLGIYFGHSSNYWWRPGQYDTIFSLIPELELGDKIFINFQNQRYAHSVTNKQIISVRDWTELNNPQIKNGLALVTCWPLGTTWRRYVVWAEKK